jgi:methylenetetrahydrofolate reductase (NADPH)
MIDILASPRPTGGAAPHRRIVAALHGFSLEATRPGQADIDAVAAAVPPGTRLYISAVAGHPLEEQPEFAAMAHRAGLTPVLHLAARSLESHAQAADLLAHLRERAQATHLLVIGGDRADAAGPFATSLDLIESGLLQRYGITHIGIAGHPEGHPKVATHILDRALQDKIEAAEQGGLVADIVTQFSFNADAVIGWTRRLRDYGIETPVRIGLAGPTNLTTLLKYARRCGVKASAGGLARNAGRLKHLFGVSTPDALICALAQAGANGALGDVALHFFSFGSIGGTARWSAHAAAGRFTCEGENAFAVED